MISFGSFSGIITGINDFFPGGGQVAGCRKLFTVEDMNGYIVNFQVNPDTYFVNHITMRTGDAVTGYYDTSVPVILIYPPQYQALVMAKASRFQNVKADYFNSELISSDGALQLNISPSTRMILKNDQPFTGDPANRNLIVIYGATTRSIPAQTAPYKIIVLCE